MRRYLLVAVVLGMLVAACGTSDSEVTTSTAASTSTTTTRTEATTTTHGQVTTTLGTTTTVLTPTTTTTLPGEPIDFGPRSGDRLMVVGVAFDDVLNLRAAPGPDYEVVATIEPTFTDLVARGATRQIPNAFWIEVDYSGVVGWVNLSYVAYEGSTDDLTSAVVDELGGIPSAQSMTELGRIVAGTLASVDPESDIVLVVAETIGDLGEVTYDVIGLGDDSVYGIRAHVFGEPAGDGFSLKSVEGTNLCGRGVTEDGLCT